MGDSPDYENGQPRPVPNTLPSMHDLVIEDIAERKNYGLAKYDSLLQPFNGRNFLQDAYEEVQDMIVYLRGSIEEQAVVELFYRGILKCYLTLFESAYPEDKDTVLLKAVYMPGWLEVATREILGDRFEYGAEKSS